MSSVKQSRTAEMTGISPQFLVDKLESAIEYYRDTLGFTLDFVYESFYASVSRDGFSIHLKCAPKTDSDRTHRQQNEHLDAYISVRGIEALYEEFDSRGTRITHPLESKPCGCKEFYVEDIDGHILCFSELTA